MFITIVEVVANEKKEETNFQGSHQELTKVSQRNKTHVNNGESIVLNATPSGLNSDISGFRKMGILP